MKSGRLLRLAVGIVTALLITIFHTSTGAAAGMHLSATVVVSQLYGGADATGAMYSHNYIELFNRGSEPVSLDGWSLQTAPVGSSAWTQIPLNGTLEGGRYYLIQLGGEMTGSTLPRPDGSGIGTLGATGGKVALVRSTELLTESCPHERPELVDLVGYGNASCAEAVPSGRAGMDEALVRRGAGCTESDHNANDFEIGAPAPRNSNAPAEDCRVPIVLVSYTMHNERDYIDIRWETSFEEETRGYNLYRGTDTSQDRVRINPSEIPAYGGTGQINRYSHPDYNVEENETYYYFLEEVALDGSRTVIGVQFIMRENPSAVTVQDFSIAPSESSNVTALIALVGAALTAAWVWRQAR